MCIVHLAKQESGEYDTDNNIPPCEILANSAISRLKW